MTTNPYSAPQQLTHYESGWQPRPQPGTGHGSGHGPGQGTGHGLGPGRLPYTPPVPPSKPAPSAPRKGVAAMSGDIRTFVLLAATLTTGLMAGLYFAFSVAVMPGLGKADDRTFIEGVQRINVAILNGWFSLAFGGALVLGGIAVALHWRGEGRPALPWIIAGVVLYTASLLITMGLNVPLNDQLANAGNPAKIHDPAAVRAQFESAWLHWNTARVLTSTAALGCLSWALRAGRG